MRHITKDQRPKVLKVSIQSRLFSHQQIIGNKRKDGCQCILDEPDEFFLLPTTKNGQKNLVWPRKLACQSDAISWDAKRRAKGRLDPRPKLN